MANVNDWSPIEDGNVNLDQYSLERQISPESELNRYTKKIMAAVRAKADAMQAEIDTLAPTSGVVHIDGEETVGGVKTFEEPIVGDVSVQTPVQSLRRTLGDRFAEYINVKDYGAKGLGNTDDDDAPAFSAAIAAAIEQHKDVYIPGGTYVLKSTILIEGASNLRISGRGADTSVLYSYNIGHVIRPIGCDHLTFEDFSVEHRKVYNSNNEEVKNGNTFQVEDCTYATFRRLAIQDARFDAMCLVSLNYHDFESEPSNSKYLKVCDCRIDSARGGAGIRVLRSLYVDISGSRVSNCHHEATCLDFGSYRCIVSENFFSNNGGAGQISLDGGSSSLIIGNALQSPDGSGVPCIVSNGNLETTYGVAIVGNNCFGGAKGIWLKGLASSLAPNPGVETNYYGSNRCVVCGNVIRNTPIGIQLEARTRDNVLLGNSFTNCTKAIQDNSTEIDNWITPERIGVANLGAISYPTSEYKSLTVPASGDEVTATEDGIAEFFYNTTGAAYSGWRGIRNITTGERCMLNFPTSADGSGTYNVHVRKGETISVSYPSGSTGHTLVIRLNVGRKMYADMRSSS